MRLCGVEAYARAMTLVEPLWELLIRDLRGVRRVEITGVVGEGKRTVAVMLRALRAGAERYSARVVEEVAEEE